MNTNNKNIKKKYEGGNIEHEYQFPDINKKEIIKKIKRLGGKRIHRNALYTSVYYWNYKENYFYRIRKEYNNITLTKKVLRESKMPLEYEINILSGSTFEEIEDFLNNIMDLSKCGKIEVEKFREKLKGDGFIRRFSNATRVVSTDMRVDMLVKPACETLVHAGDPVDEPRLRHPFASR